ncbi:MAG: DUF2088 domain-containing protein [Verrucomicrobia bacterium]|nr:DUF2088 domain-containing protein [Verrucomicrobiota bacterium]
MSTEFPRMLGIRQKYPHAAPLDILATLRRELELQGILRHIKPRARIAVATGSRGITNIQIVVASVIELLKQAGAAPFVIPAMGSHGGATPEGQAGVLAEYGITEATVKAPINAAMEVEQIGSTEAGVPVYLSAEALRADGIVVVNRVKPHTDFSGAIGSGILKMLVIGLGKRTGAAAFHQAASRLGYERVIRSIARITLKSAPILCGVALVENQLHETAKIAVLNPGELERREEELFAEAQRLMPKLPFNEIDLLIVDRVGKNISGAGMDPNIIGRGIHGYSSFLGNQTQAGPNIRRIFVQELTPETHGNAVGIGFADFTTARLVRSIDYKVTAVNALTALTPQSAKVPIHFDTDREAIYQALVSLALPDLRQAKVMRIADTLSLARLEVSEAYQESIRQDGNLETANGAEELRFDAEGNLLPLRA